MQRYVQTHASVLNKGRLMVFSNTLIDIRIVLIDYVSYGLLAFTKRKVIDWLVLLTLYLAK